MATPGVLQGETDLILSSPLIELRKGENGKSRGLSIEKKIELLESLTGKVTNRRSRRWLNDRLLMELVPRLNAEEVRGLFAPPPWGDDVPPSAFCMTNVGEWDKFRTIDMDKEANIIGALNNSSMKKKFHADADKAAFLSAWRRVDCRTREALRRSFLSDLIASYEDCIRTFIQERGHGDVLALQVQDPFHRLLLHGVCEFYNVVSVTVAQSKGAESLKVTRIKKKKTGVVDAFTNSAFKGNPAAVCLLEEERDEKWMQAVAAEFNISETCYLTRITNSTSPNTRFRLRWFTPVAEVNLCGHATLASAHTLFTTGLVNSSIIEFDTLSGILTAKKVPDVCPTNVSEVQNGGVSDRFLIELNFPTVPVTDFNSAEASLISKALNDAPLIDVKRTTTADDIFVVLQSGKSVIEMEPRFDDILKCPGRGLIVSGAAPSDSEFDFISRFFCPKYGINEDPVCGSAHCALAPYWSQQLGKLDFVAHAASPRGGIVKIHLDEQNHRVLLRGKAVTVMEGSVLV
ncbi:hypothetical protein Goshw_025827 [Gossypium schwendimanii]|uniref:R3H-associated N-terminal domain-containing protein n=1 Tax=Gossypium schwendimanii TaxID=34291 RepID=A0A7J9NFB5_GOSSC|nr:hypothetical protein [Gossypium schwendimanii]